MVHSCLLLPHRCLPPAKRPRESLGSRQVGGWSSIGGHSAGTQQHARSFRADADEDEEDEDGDEAYDGDVQGSVTKKGRRPLPPTSASGRRGGSQVSGKLR